MKLINTVEATVIKLASSLKPLRLSQLINPEPAFWIKAWIAFFVFSALDLVAVPLLPSDDQAKLLVVSLVLWCGICISLFAIKAEGGLHITGRAGAGSRRPRSLRLLHFSLQILSGANDGRRKAEGNAAEQKRKLGVGARQ